ncbi:MAG: hypothetical protein M1324_02055 [Patescibacteria group bacterium]|nr:hypothetical protein [Patescibacteria group bacterium]
MKKIGLKHINFLTDSFGIWQHTNGRRIDRIHGYALDDGARGLLVALKFKDYEKAEIYLNFIKKAVGNEGIINFHDSQKKPLDKPWSEDALGETYWALSAAIAASYQSDLAQKIIHSVIFRIKNFRSIRGRAYAILGASLIDLDFASSLINSLKADYLKNITNEWKWIEDELSYANAIIPLSFLCAAEALKQSTLGDLGLEMLDFLNNISKEQSCPIVIGNKGWFPKHGRKAIFDQQPIDAAYQVLANLKAYKQTNNKKYLKEAKIYFSWFWGNNIIRQSLINKRYESCGDGLGQIGIDLNCGAESTICYLLAQEEIWPYFTDEEKNI